MTSTVDRGNGVEAFVYPAELAYALAAHHGPGWEHVSLPRTADQCRSIVGQATTEGRSIVVYDRLTRSTRPYDPSVDC